MFTAGGFVRRTLLFSIALVFGVNTLFVSSVQAIDWDKLANKTYIASKSVAKASASATCALASLAAGITAIEIISSKQENTWLKILAAAASIGVSYASWEYHLKLGASATKEVEGLFNK